MVFSFRVVGTLSVSIPMVLNGAIGAKLHVPFSVITSTFFCCSSSAPTDLRLLAEILELCVKCIPWATGPFAPES